MLCLGLEESGVAAFWVGSIVNTKYLTWIEIFN